LRGALEGAVEGIGEGEKGGGGGKRGWNERRATSEPRSGKGEIAKSGKYLRRRHFGVQKELRHSRFVVSFDARERSFPEPLCQGFCWQRLFSSAFGRRQESSRIRVRPSPNWISFGLQSGLTPSPPPSPRLLRSRRLRRTRWTNGSGSGADGFLPYSAVISGSRYALSPANLTKRKKKALRQIGMTIFGVRHLFDSIWI
jgi:hypothetical protein